MKKITFLFSSTIDIMTGNLGLQLLHVSVRISLNGSSKKNLTIKEIYLKDIGHSQNLQKGCGTWLRKHSAKREDCQATVLIKSQLISVQIPQPHPLRTKYNKLPLSLDMRRIAVCQQNGLSSVSAAFSPIFVFCVQDWYT